MVSSGEGKREHTVKAKRMQPQIKPDTTTDISNKMPPGIPYIIGNELAERFSYYGMKTILVVFMTKHLLDTSGNLSVMGETEATMWNHVFVSVNYFFPIIGAIISDIFWGKYKTILRLSVFYCLGHLTLAMFETRLGLSIGLTLIAMGSGGIKPCVSAHVGDQFNISTQHLLTRIFNYFYMAINIGAALSTLATPLFLEMYGPSVAFGVPGLLMLIATFLFWMGRNRFIAIPPVGWSSYKKELFNRTGLRILLKLGVVYIFIAIFWSLYDQSGSSWIIQADHMNRNLDLTFGLMNIPALRFEILPSQIQAINPILILILIPLLDLVVYPFVNKYYELTAIRKMAIGFFLAAFSFVLIAIPQARIDAGHTPTFLWQIGAYLFITTGEVLVSVTGLEFSYTQAPNSMKSFIMGFFLLSVSFGNAFTAGVNAIILNPDGSSKLTGAEYFWFFFGLMFLTSVIFAWAFRNYKETRFIQPKMAYGQH